MLKERMLKVMLVDSHGDDKNVETIRLSNIMSYGLSTIPRNNSQMACKISVPGGAFYATKKTYYRLEELFGEIYEVIDLTNKLKEPSDIFESGDSVIDVLSRLQSNLEREIRTKEKYKLEGYYE